MTTRPLVLALAIAASLAESQLDGTGLAALAALDAWKVYKERNKRK